MRVAAVRCLTAIIGLGLAVSAGAQQTVTFTDFCSTSSFTLNGASASLNPNAQCVLRLTNGFGPGSSAFLTNTFSLASNASFSTLFRFQILNPVGIGDTDGAGADGIVFAVQTVSNTAGGGGGGIGFQGISPSVGVEFDTYNNGTQDQNDPNHIGIDTNGNMTSIALTHISPRFNDGGVWFAWVDYDGVAKVLQGRVNKTGVRPVNPDVSATLDLPAILGTNNVFVGFTSGTGAGGNTHEIIAWQLVGSFQPIGGVTPTPTPGVSAIVPTLSFPMLALLGLALAGAALAFLKK
jgi:hypothetical protein